MRPGFSGFLSIDSRVLESAYGPVKVIPARQLRNWELARFTLLGFRLISTSQPPSLFTVMGWNDTDEKKRRAENGSP